MKFILLFATIFLLCSQARQSELYKFQQPRILAGSCPDGQAKINGQCQANDLDIKLLTSNAIIFKDVGFNMLWGFPDANTVHFLLEINQASFMSIGIGKTMFNSDVITAEIDGNNDVTVTDRWSIGYSAPAADAQQDTNLLGYEVSNSKVRVKFSRALKTGDSKDIDLEKGKQFTFIAAYASSKTMSQHSALERKDFTFLFDENQNVVAKEVEISDVHNFHAWVNLIAWGILVDIGIMIVRHLKTWKYYIYAHVFIFIVVDILTWIATILKIDENKDTLDDIQNDTVNVHYIMGIIFIILLFFQHSAGIVFKFAIYSFKGRKDFLYRIKAGHKYNGWLLYTLGKILVITGAYSNYVFQGREQKYYDIGILFVGISTGIQLISFASQYAILKKFKSYVLLQDYQNIARVKAVEMIGNDKNGQIMNLLHNGQDIHQIQKAIGSDVQYAILGNRVFDLTGFLHPGGNYILSKINGREIDRCFFGGYALEGDKRPGYIHSSQAESYIISKTIGILQFPESQNVLSQYSQGQDIWKLIRKENLTPTTHKFEFSNSKIQFKNYNKGVSWLGRYFQVQQKNNDKKRLYTTAQSMSSANINFRKNLVEYAVKEFEGGNLEKMPEVSNELPLIIKKYRPYGNTLSSIIHEGVNVHDFYVKGPQGVGLGLNEKSAGTYIIITGGTGILPFLDLLNMQLQKVVYELAKQKKGEDFANSNVDIHQIGLSNVLNGVNIILYSSFIEEKEFLGQDIIQPMINLCNQHSLPSFSFCAKFSKQCNIEGIRTTKSHFNKNFFNDEKKNWDKNNIQKVWVCGPPPLNAAVPNALQGLVDENKISFI